MINSNTLSYFGGLFDGDGYIYITKTKRKYCNLYVGCIGIAMSNIESIKLFQKIFGGHIREKKYNHLRNIYEITLYGRNANKVACILKPYLVSKYNRVNLINLLQKNTEKHKKDYTIVTKKYNDKTRKGPIRRKVDKKRTRYRTNLYNKMKNNIKSNRLKINPSLSKNFNPYFYIAGLLDSEGSLTISKRYERGVSIAIQIRMTDKAPLIIVKKFFGGRIVFHKKQKKNNKNFYSLGIYNEKALSSLKKIKNNLIIKKILVREIINMYKQVRKTKSWKNIDINKVKKHHIKSNYINKRERMS